MTLGQVLAALKFNGQIVIMHNGIPNGGTKRNLQKFEYYQIVYSCISDGVLVLSVK